MRRLVLDITTSAHWVGPPVGIPRVAGELARRARRYWNGPVAFVVYNADEQTFLALDAESALHVLSRQQGRAFLRSKITGPQVLRQPRKFLSLRLADYLGSVGQPSAFQWLAERLFILISREDEVWSHNVRRRVMTDFQFEPDDVLVSAGADWQHNQLPYIADLKRDIGFQYVQVCYDVIPLQFPEMYSKGGLTPLLKAFFDRLVVTADRLMCISDTVCRDLRGLYPGVPASLDVFHLGADYAVGNAAAPVPAQLAGKHYVLFVSTIEPRKNHRLAFDVWRELLQERRIPVRHHAGVRRACFGSG